MNKNTIVRVKVPVALYETLKDKILNEAFPNPRQEAFGILQTLREFGVSDINILEYILGNVMNGSEAEEAMKYAYEEFIGDDLDEAMIHIASGDNFKTKLDGKLWTAQYHNHEEGDPIELKSGSETKKGVVKKVSPNGDITIELNEAKKKPSAGMTKKEKSVVAKKAKAGKDIGKAGKGFDKLAAKAAKEYGSKESGQKVAAAAMWKAQAKKAK